MILWLNGAPRRPLVVATAGQLAGFTGQHLIAPQTILGSDEAQAWRLAHLAEYRASRSWMTATADLVVDTGRRTPAETARHIAGALPDVTSRVP